MASDRQSLIEDLVADLKPVARPGRIWPLLTAWLTLSWVVVLIAMLLVAPFRPGAFQQLLSVPRFFIENLIGLLSFALLALAAFKLAIPGRARLPGSLWLPLLLMAAWIAAYLLDLFAPSLTPSMLGKRPWCFVEVLAFGAPVLLFALFQLRRLAPIHRRGRGFLIGLAAGAIPGSLMQLACMYQPGHILTHHIAPIFALGLVGALVGSYWPSRWPARAVRTQENVSGLINNNK
jgi:hypothetical protein